MERRASVGIAGLGLIGGSIGLALARLPDPPRRIGFEPASENRRLALERGLVDRVTESVADLASADLIVLAAPVSAFPALLTELTPILGASTLLTDAASLKGSVVSAVRAALTADQFARFVGAHPMAGSERSGPTAASAELFDGRVCLLTPVAETAPAALAAVSQWWKSLGMTVRQCDPDDHDRRLARTSHLVHLLSWAIARAQDPGDREFAGPGLAGMIRLARSEPALWRSIFEHNRQPLLDALARFRESLDQLERALGDEDFARLEEELHVGHRISSALAG
jgi:prephenate dehydrogenase